MASRVQQVLIHRVVCELLFAKALAVQERKHKLEFDKALQRSRPVITGMFPDLIQQAAEAEQYASAE